jgi:hypothetical protein
LLRFFDFFKVGIRRFGFNISNNFAVFTNPKIRDSRFCLSGCNKDVYSYLLLDQLRTIFNELLKRWIETFFPELTICINLMDFLKIGSKTPIERKIRLLF